MDLEHHFKSWLELLSDDNTSNVCEIDFFFKTKEYSRNIIGHSSISHLKYSTLLLTRLF